MSWTDESQPAAAGPGEELSSECRLRPGWARAVCPSLHSPWLPTEVSWALPLGGSHQPDGKERAPPHPRGGSALTGVMVLVAEGPALEMGFGGRTMKVTALLTSQSTQLLGSTVPGVVPGPGRPLAGAGAGGQSPGSAVTRPHTNGAA